MSSSVIGSCTNGQNMDDLRCAAPPKSDFTRTAGLQERGLAVSWIPGDPEDYTLRARKRDCENLY